MFSLLITRGAHLRGLYRVRDSAHGLAEVPLWSVYPVCAARMDHAICPSQTEKLKKGDPGALLI